MSVPMTHTETAHLIRHGALEFDTARVFATDAIDAPDRSLPPDEPDWIVPLSTWLSAREELSARQHPVALLVGPADDPWSLVLEGESRIDASAWAFIAIDFPSFTDGRGFSHAQTLRQHLGYTGELRAVGDILIDTIYYLARCGFDAFAVKAGHDPHKALSALQAFSEHYQRGYADPAQARGLPRSLAR